MRFARHGAWLTAVLVASGLAAGPAGPAAASGGPDRDPDLDVLFVGAHPDDESPLLSTFGQWRQKYGVRTGVATITRGEGGGNAVGPEEGTALGLLREGEERRAVDKAGISDVYNLDEADPYYTASAPLTERVWGHADVLSKLVRVIRQTRPKVVVTKDPAPTTGTHGGHQYAARLALEAYRQAGNPAAFPQQITREGLAPWSIRRVLSDRAAPDRTVLGPGCERQTAPPSEPGPWYGVWAGRHIAGGVTWAQQQRIAEREYASQGWAHRPDMSGNPNRIGCDYLTELANRAPHPQGVTGAGVALSGALLPTAHGLPVGTSLSASAQPAQIVAGKSARVSVTVRAGARSPLPAGRLTVAVPAGWTTRGDPVVGRLRPGESRTLSFTVSAPAQQATRRVPIPLRWSTPAGSGSTETRLDVVPPVVAEQAPLPGVAEFRRWAAQNEFPALANVVPPVQPVPSGGGRQVPVIVHNYDNTPHSGVTRMVPPRGFGTPEQRQPFGSLAPGTTGSVSFRVVSTNPGMATGMQGGDHHYMLAAQPSSGMPGSTRPALELVPSTTIPHTERAPTVDASGTRAEYPGSPLDLSSRWEGQPCSLTADCSATARLSWHGDTLYGLVNVTDDRQGSRLSPSDCKRHWRTDSVEIAVDPAGRSENTSSTLKLGVLPRTNDPQGGNPPCYERDADNHQGPGEQTAPGVRVASRSHPGGYRIEVAIPVAALPGAVDPRHVGLNMLVYDSDTKNKTGQTRIGWSTWPGVQGDPYRWGRAVLAGRPRHGPWNPPPAQLPLRSLASVDSPASIAQSVRLGTALGGAAPAGKSAPVLAEARMVSGQARTRLAGEASGRVHLFVVDPRGRILGDRALAVDGRRWVSIPVRAGTPARVLVGFTGADGVTAGLARRIS